MKEAANASENRSFSADDCEPTTPAVRTPVGAPAFRAVAAFEPEVRRKGNAIEVRQLPRALTLPRTQAACHE